MTWIIGVLGFLLIAGLVYWWYTSTGDKGRVLIQRTASGKETVKSGAILPRSFNQPEGAVFTYTCWFVVNDYTFNYGKKRTLFNKADCPGVALDSTSNGLMITIETYGAKETILIPNLPAQKWIHLAVSVNQYAVDIFINGLIRQHHTLTQLPKQNEETVTVGGDSEWDCTISDLVYYNRSLTAADLDALVKNIPPNPVTAPAGPPYFGLTWYTG